MSFMKATVIFKETAGKILLLFQPLWKVLRVLLLKDGGGQGSTRAFKCPLAKLLAPESFLQAGEHLPCRLCLTGAGFSNFGLPRVLPAAPH